MQFHNRKKIAYYSALAILFSYGELMLPHFLPFFKYGLGNTVVLLSLSFSPLDFIFLLIIKAAASSLISGILFTPFFILSIAQSLASGLAMFFLAKVRGRFFSIYGISIFGSAISAFVQIFLASFFLGESVYSVLGLMLLFSLFSGLITAFLSEKLLPDEKLPELKSNLQEEENADSDRKMYDFSDNLLSILSIFLILFIIILVFLTKDPVKLFLMLITSLFFQHLFKRKIFFLMHFFTWLIIILSGTFQGGGEILFKTGFITIYRESLIDSLVKALRLSCIIAVSQSSTAIRLRSSGIISLTLRYFSSLLQAFENFQGNFFEKIKRVFTLEKLSEEKTVSGKANTIYFLTESLIITLLFLLPFNHFSF